MASRFIKGILTLIIAISFLVVIIMVTLIVQNYTDTKQWNMNQLNEEIHNTPPQLAKDYVSLDDQHLLELLSKVNQALSDIGESKGIDPSNMDSYRHLYEQVSTLQEELDLENSELTAPVQTLGLYLDIEQAVKSAYTKPNPSRFAELTDRLSERLLNNKDEMDTFYLDMLTDIAKRYRNLDEFVSYALGIIGEIEEGILTVTPSINKEITNDLVNQISQNELQMFSNIERLKKLLTNPDWETIIQHADAGRSYKAWMEAKPLLEALSKSDYIAASTFQTYEDVISYGYQANIPEREGYRIDTKSRVSSITVNGQPVSDDAYFKRQSNAQFTFDAEYIYEVPEPDEIPSYDIDTDYNTNYDNNYESDFDIEYDIIVDKDEPNYEDDSDDILSEDMDDDEDEDEEGG